LYKNVDFKNRRNCTTFFFNTHEIKKLFLVTNRQKLGQNALFPALTGINSNGHIEQSFTYFMENNKTRFIIEYKKFFWLDIQQLMKMIVMKNTDQQRKNKK
jgi:hypothetical protein